jgi:molecular chaperone GrpE (heat shock protein)
MSKFDEIREEIKGLYDENIHLNNWISTQEQSSDNQVSEICKDFLQVLEAFEWAEATIHERGLDQSKISTSAIARMLTAKTKLIEVLEHYGAFRVSFPDDDFDATKAKIVGTEPDEEKADGKVLRIVRDGFYRKDRLLRQAEVIVVKNS